MENRDKLYIDGAWVPSTGTGTIDVINASTEEVMGRIPDGTPEDVDRAVRAAKRAFPGWAATDKEERGKYLQRITEGLQARMGDIGNVVAQEVGMPINLSTMIQAGLPIMTFGSMGQLLDTFPFEEQVGNSLIVREPVGVVGAITPWNYPLHQIAAKEEPSADPEDRDDELGDLPEELRDLPDPTPEPRGSVHPQPVSISLNKA